MKLRLCKVGKCYKITEEPASKYRSIDDPFNEDKKCFWVLIEKKGTYYYIIDSSLLDYENNLTAFCVDVDGKRVFEHFFELKDPYYCLIRFQQDSFEISSYVNDPMGGIIEFLKIHPLMTINPNYAQP